MRSAGNFHPQWGYLAPAPSFLRGARIVLVATAVGATAGAAVVVSLLERPGADADNSIAAHALVTSAPAGATGTPAPLAAVPASKQALAPAPADAAVPQPVQSPSASSRSVLANASEAASAHSAAPSGSVASSAAAAQSHAGVAALPSTTAATESAPVPHAEAAAAAESKPAAPTKRFASKRHRTASNEPSRRWQGEDAWRRRRWRDNGFTPRFRLFSSRTGFSDYPN